MNIDLKDTLINSLKNGVSLFLGAGFSILAKDKENRTLPLGAQLRDELATNFNLPNSLELSQLATIIESTNKKGLTQYLKKRFDVNTYDDKYDILKNICIKSIFTTNIDNLIPKIYSNSTNNYLNDITSVGPSYHDKLAIDYAPLHGAIYDDERKMVFSTIDLATTFSNEQNTWFFLRNAVSKHPIIFIGYGLNDASVIQALFSGSSKLKPHQTKWILLYKSDEASKAYFKSLGFNIIEGSVEELLDFFKNELNSNEQKKNINDPWFVFPNEMVPHKSAKLPVRPLKSFFLGAQPYWSDIYNNRIPKVSHYEKIVDLIYAKKNIIVLGLPASGKTTLMMQIAAFIDFKGLKLICNNMNIEKANVITNRLLGDRVLIFIDNFTDTIEVFEHFKKFKNITLVGFDRQYNYEIISHRINRSEFEIYDITNLTLEDIQLIYSQIPSEVRKSKLISQLREGVEPSIFEFVNLNINQPDINKRYKDVINELDNKDPLLSDFLVMTCYVSACRTPVSFDMALNFLDDSIESYEEIYNIISNIGELISEYDGYLVDENQDFFIARSSIVSEAILEQVPTEIFSRVINRFHSNVPKYAISRYDIFKTKGYDANFIKKAFPNWRDGLEFYELAYESDRSPFILQQGALYLASKKKYQDAFKWIDQAILTSSKKFFSIRNTHAIIQFEANINSDDRINQVRYLLDESMTELEKCYNDDKRKLYHVLTYGRQSIQYFSRFNDEKSIDYLQKAQKWLIEEKKENYWNYELNNLLKQIEPLIRTK
jgi:hypothetical protein